MSMGEDQTSGPERQHLLWLAYRLLGSWADAEDAVQEALARWYALSADEQGRIRSPSAWLSTVTSHLCLDLLRSARTRRERYVGPWLPEPVPGQVPPANPEADPGDRIDRQESVTMAFLVVLDTMTPAERVAFVLHDIYAYPFAEVARILGRTEAASRQLASSARRRVAGTTADDPPPGPGQTETVRRFRRAWAAQDIRALVALLDPDATVVADGGGIVGVLPVTSGREQIAAGLVGIAAKSPEVVLTEQLVNGRPGLVSRRDGEIVAVVALEVQRDRITRIWSVLNPAKLGQWEPVPSR